MNTWEYLVLGIGVVLVMVVLADVFLLVLHMESEGWVAPRLFRAIWFMTMIATRLFPKARRSLLALAGPLMMAALFVLWLVIFILGFSLIIWPFIDTAYRTESELGPLVFLDAFYYAGVTVNVLGYGDITPLTGSLKLLVVAMSGLGFALLTGVVTYLLNVVSGAADRNRLALQVRAASGADGTGFDVVVLYLRTNDIQGLQSRVLALLESLQGVQEKMHQFPILDVYYRSRMAARDPEPIIRDLVEMAIALRVAAQASSARRLAPLVWELAESLDTLIGSITEQHFSRKSVERLDSAEPGETERSLALRTRDRLRPYLKELDDAPPPEDLFGFICRSRLFLEELNGFSGWQRDHNGKDVIRIFRFDS